MGAARPGATAAHSRRAPPPRPGIPKADGRAMGVMAPRTALALLLAVSFLLAGCTVPEDDRDDQDPTRGDPGRMEDGGDRHDEDPDPWGDGGSSHQGGDSCDLDAVLERLEQDRPSWEAIDCMAADTPEHAYPDFAARLLASSEQFGQQSGLVQMHMDLWEDVRTTEPVTLSSANMASMPPWADPQGQTLEYPLSPHWHDESLRGVIPPMLAEKRAGTPVLLQNHYPHGMLGPEFEDPDQFRAWMEDHFLPEKEREAEAAQRAGIEAYAPFPIEVEVYFNHIDQPTLNELPTEELVTLAQEWVDATLETVRPLYDGHLVAHSYAKYDFRGAEWQEISFAGFDEVAFSLFPECDMNITRDYLETQLDAYMAMVARDGVAWSIGEFGADEDNFELCGTDFDAIEQEIYQTVFDAVDARAPTPVGMGVAWLPGDSEVAGEAVRAYFLERGA